MHYYRAQYHKQIAQCDDHYTPVMAKLVRRPTVGVVSDLQGPNC